MRVISGLADVDFDVASVSREGPYLVVRNGPQAGLPTAVYVERRDLIVALKAVFGSLAVLGWVLSAPFRRGAPGAGPATRLPARDNVNNPWL
jgi:hypothetical protein